MLALAAAAQPAAAQKRTAPLPLTPPPFIYVGTLDQGGERYAVLAARDQSVLLVRAGEAINNQYRLQSIEEERVMIVNLTSGAVQALARAESPAPAAQATPVEGRVPEPPNEPEAESARPGYAH